MNFSIKKIAEFAGVTTRTLRYYDEIGLLKPAGTGSNGYRFYNNESLLLLQQILFFRELDVPLDIIQLIMSQPDFNMLDALEKHRSALETKAARLEKLINTVNKTIADFKGEENMKENEYFDGFDESQYEEEARQRWGHTPEYAESQRKWASFSKEQKQAIREEGGDFIMRMVTTNPDAKPDDLDVQAAVEGYHAYINKYFYSCDAEFMRNLADMWVQDERFAINYERIRKGGSAFARDAVTIFCDRRKEKS